MPYIGFEEVFYAQFEKLKRQIEMSPIVLGGVAASGGGQDGRPGSFIGYLPQTRITYDRSEVSLSGTSGSPSLLDNLNHIRYDIDDLENIYLRLDASNDPVTEAIQFQNAVDSTTAFQVLDAASGVILNVDTVNKRVGIGTDTPSHPLTVVSTLANVGKFESSNVISVLEISNTSGAEQRWQLKIADSSFFAFRDRTTAKDIIVLETGMTSSNALYIDVNRNIALGSNSPQAKLHVIGDADNQQLIIQAHSTQNVANIFEIQKSDTTVLSGADERGILFSDGGTGIFNFFAGSDAGNNSATGTGNIGIGSRSSRALTSGSNNVGIGSNALDDLQGGSSNFALGANALSKIVNTGSNVAVGNSALSATTGGNNVGIGGLAGRSIVGSNNVFIGTSSAFSATSGSNNIFLGNQSGYRQTTPSNLFIVNNQLRANPAEELTNSILYGVMAAAPANQTLRINAVILGSQGAKIGDAGVTDYTEFEADGTVVFTGAATVFKDINLGAAVLTKPAVSQPDEVNFVDENGDDTEIASLGFDVGEKVSGNFELQHDYKEGTNLVFHVHWQGKAAPTGTDKVKWQLTYTVAQTGETLDATTAIVIETDFDTQYEFKESDFAAITGTNFNIEDQFLFTLERIAASVDEYAGDGIVATVGIHYEIDTVGSRQVLVK